MWGGPKHAKFNALFMQSLMLYSLNSYKIVVSQNVSNLTYICNKTFYS